MTGGKDGSGCMEVQPWCGARERKATASWKETKESEITA